MGNIIETYVSRKVVLIFSILATIGFLAFLFPQISGLCSEYQPNCRDPFHYAAVAVLWAPALLLLSLFMGSIEKKALGSWSKFALSWIIVSTIVVYLISPQSNFNEPDWKSIVSLSLAAIFFVISVAIILKNRSS